MKKILLDMTFVSSILIWELMHFTKMNSWKNDHFNFDILIKQIENSENIVIKRFFFLNFIF